MKRIILSSIGLLFIAQSALGLPMANSDVNKTLLPSSFPVYILGDDGVINHPYPGADRAILPTDNSYTMAPGCYIACYSHNRGVYPVAPDIFVMGQIRVQGEYLGRICQPKGYKGMDISKAEKFKFLCSEKFNTCKNNTCWAGGDTGGWFGIK
ncbi:hypothetical protein OQJ18_04715 [Fluoribacter dumoffii]|uniref:Uncharacterized protein n=1 Tax=Fluoribacter dumoffii TaxID=463 RepID=A0A377G995_9GAMM|nr:hypothetical protein [Fluoribacter dumoffii]KTC90265.1 hypothetical protein Ldum_1333 [Fluoribacter dumoffii NY 23]MCW8385583.1 hypothetical protein [Fluoribacter dumoffii]MCW8418610.1 hypothetical protein [Fluoribacter dumoffii]MCW8453546.1 hypothetical protein [Fluoribacter dumoffii]MCW8459235.1 hypothetical protein [Fluoribacter dumoffii]